MPSSLSLRKAGSNSDVLFWRFDDDWPGAITVSVLDNAISATQIRAGVREPTTLMLTYINESVANESVARTIGSFSKRREYQSVLSISRRGD